jgi:hypothetical protein
MRCRCGKEAVGGGRDELREACLRFGTVKTAAHQIHTGLLGGRGFLRGLDVNVGQAPFALELLEIIDGEFLAGSKHGARVLKPTVAGNLQR